jgi:hypothetical protein
MGWGRRRNSMSRRGRATPVAYLRPLDTLRPVKTFNPDPRRSVFSPCPTALRTDANVFTSTSKSISRHFRYRNLRISKEFPSVEEIYMNSNLNKPTINLRTTAYVRRFSWAPWVAILTVSAVAVLAWNFWPYANSPDASTKESRVPATQRTTTQPPATSMPPVTAPAQL